MGRIGSPAWIQVARIRPRPYVPLRSFTRWARTLLALALVVGWAVARPTRVQAFTSSPIFVVGQMDNAWMPNQRELIASPSDTAQIRRVLQFFAESYHNTVVLDIADLRDATIGPKILHMAAGLGLHILAMTGGDDMPLTPSSMGLTLSSPDWQALLGYRWGGPDPDGPPVITASQAASMKLPDPTKILSTSTNHEVPTFFPPLPSAPVMDYLAVQNYIFHADWYTGLHPAADNNSLKNRLFEIDPNLSTAFLTAAGVPTLWSMGYAWNSDDHSFPLADPDPAQVRMMALWPVVTGATGELWWHWSFSAGYETQLPNYVPPGEPAEVETILKLPSYHRIAAVNKYLLDIAAPAVMGGTYLGQFHDACEVPGQQPVVPCTFSGTSPNFCTSLPGDQRPLVYSLGANTMAGAFRFVASGDTTYTLLVGNKINDSLNTTIVLKGHTSYEVGIAPSAIGYDVPSGYAPLPSAPTDTTVTPANWNDHQTTFTLKLAPEEVRILKIRPLAPTSHIAALTAPLGGASWITGQSVNVKWSGLHDNIKIKLFVDRLTAPGLVGPSILLASPANDDTTATITVPNVTSTKAHLEVSGNTPAGEAVRLNHQAPISICATTADLLTPTSMRSTLGYVYSDLTMGSNSLPAALTMTGWSGSGDCSELLATSSGTWASATISDGRCAVDNGQASSSPGLGKYGLFPSIRVSAGGTTHAAYFSLFYTPTLYLRSQGGCTYFNPTFDSAGQVLRYQRKTATGGWNVETVDWVGTAFGGCSMALDASGEPFIAYNAGPWGNYALRLKHRENVGTGTDWVTYGDSHDDMVNIEQTLDPYAQASAVDLVRATAVISEGDALYAGLVSRVTGKMYVVSHGLDDPGSPWVLEVSANGGELVKLTRAPDGYPVVVYTVPGTTPGSTKILYRKVVLLSQTNTISWGFPEVVDDAPMHVTGLAVSFVGNDCVVLYSANGALMDAARSSSGTWARRIRDVVHNVEGPLGIASNASSDRWYSFWDRGGDQLLSSSIIVSAGGDDGGDHPPHDGGAITLRGENPVKLDGRLVFGLELGRAAEFRAELVDVGGRRVASQPPIHLAAGMTRQEWHLGNSVRPGIYFVRAWLDSRQLLSQRIAILH